MSKVKDRNASIMFHIEKDMENYPPTLQAKHISEYLGVGLGTAYKLLKSGNMPAISVPDSKFILVPKSLFIVWYAQSLSRPQNSLDELGENVV